MSHDLFSTNLLLDIALKSLLLISVTAIGASCLRYRSAATIHRWWVLGFCGCLIIPVVALLSPTWNLPILPTSPPAVEPRFSVSPPRVDNQALPTAENSVARVPVQQITPVGKEESHATTKRRPPASNLLSIAESPSLSWTFFLGTIWIAGTLACLLRAIWQQVLLTRMLHCCTWIDEQSWKIALQEASSSLGLQRQVTLLKLPQTQSPLTAGLVRPVVILPQDADDWTPARRRLVLLHELAHVKRHDVLTQTLAGLVCAFYWFNPFCWYGLWQMRKLRELACDDLVLTCGQPPTDYADVLLDVARSYRHRSLPTAVGITHGSNVENRILAILDKARSHVSLSRRAARTLLVAATALVLLIGSMRLESQAEPPSAADSSEAMPGKLLEETPANADGTRTMELFVRDEDDVPVPDANVTVRVRQVYMGKDTFTKFQCDESGRLEIDVPQLTPYLFSATVSESGYVPYLAEWISHDTLDPIPAEYKMYLDAGRTIGGIVRDEKGKPIEDVQVSPFFNITQRPERTNQLGWGRSVKTNADGEWTFTSLPTDLQEVALTFKHPDFVEQRITEPVAKLAIPAGGHTSAVSTMKQGIVFGGRVTGPDGTPLDGAKVRYFKRGRFSSDSPTATTDEDGNYRFYSGEEGGVVLTASMAGLAPAIISDDIADTMDAIDFQLDAGSPLSVRVVGPDKEPLEGAHVSFWIWDELPVYGSIPESSGKTNAKGVWVWGHAPQGTLKFAVSHPGYVYIRETELLPGEENVVAMRRESAETGNRTNLQISGRVLDAEKKSSISRFRTTAGYKRQAGGRTIWLQDTQAKGRDGAYRRIFSSNDLGSDMYAIALRVEADGYKPAVVEQVLTGKQVYTEDVALEKAEDAGFRVLMPNGEAANDATVAVCTSEVGPIVQDGSVIPNSTCEQTTTDVSGRFSITPQQGLFNLLVLHASGAALVTQSDLADSPTIALEPWAHVEGTLRMQGEPATNESITLNRVDRHSLNLPKIHYQYRTKTNQAGEFSFERVIPGNVQVARVAIGQLGGGMSRSTPTIVEEVRLVPGEITQVELGRAGQQIVGKLVMPAEAEKSVHWPLAMLNLQSRPKNAPDRPKIPFPPHIDPEKDQNAARVWWIVWQDSEAGKHYQEEMKKYAETFSGFKSENYIGCTEPDGTFQFDDIPPGDYQLNVQAYNSSPKHIGMHGDRIGTLSHKFVVPETSDDSEDDPVNLGELALEPFEK